MKKSPLKECVEYIENCKRSYLDDDSPYILGPDQQAFKISEDHIFKIPEHTDHRKLAFVDGGNAPIIASADFSISFNRVGGALFDANRWVQPVNTPMVIEFYSSTVLDVLHDGSMAFVTKLFPREAQYQKFLPKKDISIKIHDPTILTGRGFLPKIEKFGAIARRFAEWSYAAQFIENELDEGDIFVRDGSLQTGYTGEVELSGELYFTALAKKVYVTGISKSCRLFTQNGDSLISLIDFIASKKYPESAWYYHPIYRITKADNQADLYFVKLHKDSYYPFRFDIYIEQSKQLDKDEKEVIISNIARNSNELSFPGYPYGLIKADQLSRVANKELNSQKIQLLSEFNEKTYEKFILPRLRSVDAHDILNKIRK